MYTAVSAADVDATLAGLDDDALIQIVEQTPAPPPSLPWDQMTPNQRRALRASNLLNQRLRAAQQQQSTHEAQIEYQAVAARIRREERATAALEPFIERKRQERLYRDGL